MISNQRRCTQSAQPANLPGQQDGEAALYSPTDYKEAFAGREFTRTLVIRVHMIRILLIRARVIRARVIRARVIRALLIWAL
ncbi:MAG: hypothetical protein EBX66_08200 [Betaproteobacteria bacterium]|nr:hypothetical protein [Betaproteobacteria bacterium]